MDISQISMADLQTLTGRKISFAEKISLTLAQRKLRKNISPDGTIEAKKFERFFAKTGGETGFHAGGFFLGFLLGLIGVLIAYLINDDYNHNRVRWAWIGLAVDVGIFFILTAALGSTVY